MPVRRAYPDRLVVHFVRIGRDHDIPDLAVRGGHPDVVREQIHAFVSKRLGTSGFTVQLWDDAGFIDRGTHSDGAFTLRAATQDQDRDKPAE